MQKILSARRSRTAALLGLALGLGGCNAQAGDRAGGDAASQVRVLTLANANDDVPVEVSSWAAQVPQLSKGTLRIQVKESWRSGRPGAAAKFNHDLPSATGHRAWAGRAAGAAQGRG